MLFSPASTYVNLLNIKRKNKNTLNVNEVDGCELLQWVYLCNSTIYVIQIQLLLNHLHC